VQLDTLRKTRILGQGDTLERSIIADVSFASPLSSTVTFTPGERIRFGDLLRIYRFDNKLVLMNMTGKEIKGYLEHSYSLWINQMHSPNDEFLPFTEESTSPFLFRNPRYNFDSGAGLDYEVDVTKPAGQRVKIKERLWNGKPFIEDSTYIVAVNHYRFSGAGGHMELGAKITPAEAVSRVVYYHDVQVLRMIQSDFSSQQKHNHGVELFQYDHWKFIPDDYVIPAMKRDVKTLQRRHK
jgi:2',3'-cyclic-nucleotide 2'-phosphodiesterase/3'-nucleotidase